MWQEHRLAELSAMVGRYEATRQRDLETIANLRAGPDEPAKGRGDGYVNDNGGNGSDVDSGAIAALEDKVAHLKSMLYLANQRLVEDEGVAAGEVGLQAPSHHNTAASAEADLEPAIQAARAETDKYYHSAVAAFTRAIEAKRQCTVEIDAAAKLATELAEVRRAAAEDASTIRAEAGENHSRIGPKATFCRQKFDISFFLRICY